MTISVKEADADFGVTLARFKQLLAKNEYAKNIVWVMSEDILLTGKRFVYVRVPTPLSNEMRVRTKYNEGLAHGRGVLLSAICEIETSTCCCVWYPRRTEEEPQGMWPQDGSAKLSARIGTSRITGKPIRSRLLWALLKLRHLRNKQRLTVLSCFGPLSFRRFILSGLRLDARQSRSRQLPTLDKSCRLIRKWSART